MAGKTFIYRTSVLLIIFQCTFEASMVHDLNPIPLSIPDPLIHVECMTLLMHVEILIDIKNSMVIARRKGGWQEIEESKGGDKW